MHVVSVGKGWLEVICGPMFSGKSEELIRRLRRVQIAKMPLQIFKPYVDTRYDENRIVSHSAQKIDAVCVQNTVELEQKFLSSTEVLGIDEVQFFDTEIVPFARTLANRGVRVIVAGLDQDYTGKAFEPMPALLTEADYVTKTLAICSKCGAPANRSQRLTNNPEQVVIGATDIYEARCRNCHVPWGEPTTGDLFRQQKIA